MHCDPGYVVASDLDLAGAEPGTDIDAEFPAGGQDGVGALDGAGWAIKGGKGPVTRGFHNPISPWVNETSHRRVVSIKKFVPRAVTQRRCLTGRIHDVSEQHRGVMGGPPGAGEELRDGVHPPVDVAAEREVDVAGKLNELRPWDRLRQVAGVRDLHQLISRVQHKSRQPGAR